MSSSTASHVPYSYTQLKDIPEDLKTNLQIHRIWLRWKTAQFGLPPFKRNEVFLRSAFEEERANLLTEHSYVQRFHICSICCLKTALQSLLSFKGRSASSQRSKRNKLKDFMLSVLLTVWGDVRNPDILL